MLRACLQLLRPANVATALADVLAGFAIAGLGNRAALPCLPPAPARPYAAGIVLNDVFDREIDRLERPERPIPSGRIRTSHAAILGAGLLVLGVGAASAAYTTALFVALAIAVCVLLYDAWDKRHGA